MRQFKFLVFKLIKETLWTKYENMCRTETSFTRSPLIGHILLWTALLSITSVLSNPLHIYILYIHTHIYVYSWKFLTLYSFVKCGKGEKWLSHSRFLLSPSEFSRGTENSSPNVLFSSVPPVFPVSELTSTQGIGTRTLQVVLCSCFPYPLYCRTL